jgi:hypothetical protein
MNAGHNYFRSPASFTAISSKINKFYFSVTKLASGTSIACVVLPQAVTEQTLFCKRLHLGSNVSISDLLLLDGVIDWRIIV